MTKFVAATAVEPLAIDFHPYIDFEGVIDEPSTDQITAFQNAFIKAARKLGVRPGQTLTPEMASVLDEADAEEMNRTVQDAVINVTGGLVTQEHLDALPFRVVAAFVAWLAGELNPEAPTPGMKR